MTCIFWFIYNLYTWSIQWLVYTHVQDSFQRQFPSGAHTPSLLCNSPPPAISYLAPPAIANIPPPASPISAAANSTTADATENAHTPAIYCLCRQRCATKRCPCKLNCHPGRNCVNTVQMFIWQSNSYRSHLQRYVESWVTIGDVTIGDVRMTTGDKGPRSHKMA